MTVLDHKRGPCGAIDEVRRLLPRSYCSGRWDALICKTVYRIYSGDRGVIGAGLSAQQAWKAAAALLEEAAGAPDEGDRYLDSPEVIEMIGKPLREQGRFPVPARSTGNQEQAAAPLLPMNRGAARSRGPR